MVPHDLTIRLAFESKHDAMGFQTALAEWRSSLHSVEVNIDKKIETIDAIAEPERVFFSDYEPKDSDSPVNTLADIKGPGSVSSPGSVCLPSDPLTEFQSIERPNLFFSLGAYKMHLLDKAKGGKPDDNNLMAGSLALHQCFDGLKTTKGIPLVAIRPGDVDSDEVQEMRGQKRRKIDLRIEFYDDSAEATMMSNLKEGSRRVASSEREWESFVWVTNAERFKKNLRDKYSRTKRKWKDIDEL